MFRRGRLLFRVMFRSSCWLRLAISLRHPSFFRLRGAPCCCPIVCSCCFVVLPLHEEPRQFCLVPGGHDLIHLSLAGSGRILQKHVFPPNASRGYVLAMRCPRPPTAAAFRGCTKLTVSGCAFCLLYRDKCHRRLGRSRAPCPFPTRAG